MKTCWCGGESAVALDGRIACVASEYHDPFATGRPTEIKRLYLSGGMSGYPDCNYPLFNSEAKFLRDVGYEVVNPAEYGTTGSHYVDLLREDLRRMLDCDGVAVIENWWESVGARNEVHVAGLLKMPVRSVIEWSGKRLRKDDGALL